MSDLDADLYGDLYGADEPSLEDPPVPAKKADPKPAPTAPAKEITSTTASTTATTTPTLSSATESKPQTQNATENAAPSKPLDANPPAATSYASQIASQYMSQNKSTPPTSSIPTVSGAQPIQTVTTSDYNPPPPSREAAYSNVAPIPGAGGASGGPPAYYEHRGVRPSEMKEEGKMFIGGLNWDTTDEGLRDYFTQFGKVDACTIMRDPSGRSRCFAFLTFEDPASVNAVMVREHHLDGKIIDPKRAIPRQEHSRSQKLFIGGLAPTVTSESMREFFAQFGKVVDSTVMQDRETGRSKGFGFVTFEDTNVDPILGFGLLEIDGKMIDVKLAQPRGHRDHPGSVYGQGGQQGNFGSETSTPPIQNAAATGMGNGASTPFDPQALAQLYQRMFSQMNGANMGMNPMMGGMNPMMGMGAGMGGGMGMGTGMGMGGGAGYMNPMAGMRGGMGMGMAGGGPGMGRGGAAGPGMGMGMGGAGATGGAGGAGAGAGAIGGNIPRGPRGQGPMGGGGPGPQRSNRGGSHFHPYARG